MDKVEESTMDMQEMMEVYKKLAVPGEPHKMLARLEGSWTTRIKASMGPDQPWEESTGTCEQRMLLGGRYLQQEYASEMMDGPYAGVNLIGYDNHTRKYVSTWIDSMSTAIYCFEGTADADGRTITQKCSYDDPVRGPIVWRSVSRIIDNDTMKYEMFITPEGGSEQKEMEMTVSRKR
jgi:hypothetical protein